MTCQPEDDCFKPPAIPTEVHCLHCHREYDSYLIEWREFTNGKGETHGFWCCPVPSCDGKGFGFDIFPTDPDYVGEDGQPMWQWCDDEEDDIEDDIDTAELEITDDAQPRSPLLEAPDDVLRIDPPPAPDGNPIKPEYRRPKPEDDIPF